MDPEPLKRVPLRTTATLVEAAYASPVGARSDLGAVTCGSCGWRIGDLVNQSLEGVPRPAAATMEFLVGPGWHWRDGKLVPGHKVIGAARHRRSPGVGSRGHIRLAGRPLPVNLSPAATWQVGTSSSGTFLAICPRDDAEVVVELSKLHELSLQWFVNQKSG